MQATNILNLLLRLSKYFSVRRRKQLWLVFGSLILSSLLEVISLGALLPFLGVLMSPDKVMSYPLVIKINSYLGINTAQQLVMPLSYLFISLAIVAGLVRMFSMWVGNRVIFMSAADISIQVYNRVLNQPYQAHLVKNSSQVINSLTNNIGALASGILQQTFILCSSVVLMLSVAGLLLAVNFYLSLTLFIIFGIAYITIVKLVRKKLHQNSLTIHHEQIRLVKAIQESLGGIRDVIIDDSQQFYCDTYHKADLKLRHAQGKNLFIGNSPKFIMETIVMVSIAVLANFLSHDAGGLAVYIPLLGVLAIGAQRMLPALQQMFNAWAVISGAYTPLADILETLEKKETKLANNTLTRAPLAFNHNIQFVNARFRYNDNAKWVINGINLAITKGQRVGIIGETGGGKSTFLDILMGLLPLTEGEFSVDGQAIDLDNCTAWQKNIAHVPQHIFLSDESFAENIAFGVPKDLIDLERVKHAAKQAKIADFIEHSPDGYNGLVGERGVRLSGGQRQRIGIARALYKNASVLILDEATSALDNDTEKAIMEAIDTLDKNLTILIVAHRLNTVKTCDMIIKLDKGKVIAQGYFAEVIINNIQ